MDNMIRRIIPATYCGHLGHHRDCQSYHKEYGFSHPLSGPNTPFHHTVIRCSLCAWLFGWFFASFLYRINILDFFPFLALWIIFLRTFGRCFACNYLMLYSQPPHLEHILVLMTLAHPHFLHIFECFCVVSDWMYCIVAVGNVQKTEILLSWKTSVTSLYVV